MSSQILAIAATLLCLKFQSLAGTPVALSLNELALNYSDFTLAAESSNSNDKECIGNRIEALEVGRQCSRRCKKDIPCENTRKQCLCDGICGLSCVKPDLSCPDLPKIENGDFSPKSSLFNTKVTYQCDLGFYLFGSRERLCQGDEDWSGIPVECLAERE